MGSTRVDAPSVAELAGLAEICDLARPVVVATERLPTVVEQLKVEKARATADLRRSVLRARARMPAGTASRAGRVLYWCHKEVPISCRQRRDMAAYNSPPIEAHDYDPEEWLEPSCYHDA